jgi:hypothetical protein
MRLVFRMRTSGGKHSGSGSRYRSSWTRTCLLLLRPLHLWYRGQRSSSRALAHCRHLGHLRCTLPVPRPEGQKKSPDGQHCAASHSPENASRWCRRRRSSHPNHRRPPHFHLLPIHRLVVQQQQTQRWDRRRHHLPHACVHKGSIPFVVFRVVITRFRRSHLHPTSYAW